MEKKLRLDKYLADMGVGTRSQVKELCRSGSVLVNGQPVRKGDCKVSPETDVVEAAGRVVRYEQYVYYLLHKPAGVVTATEDKRHRTVMDCLPDAAGKNLFPVGRLDLDTEGLLLITNDGELAHRLLTPAAHVPKTYYAELDRPAEPEDCLAMESGIVLEDGTRFLPADCRILPEKEGRSVLLTIEEGKFHQVKRMWAARSKAVVYLKRLSMGPLSLGTDLRPGEYRKLTGEEIDCLKGIKEHVS